MAANQIKRMRYYEGQYLRPGDFQDEQAYHIEMRRRHLIGHHTWGIVVGLEMVQDKTSKIWYLEPGLAVDGLGREIVVFRREPLETNVIQEQLKHAQAPAKLKVWLAYHLKRTNLPPPGYGVCKNQDQHTRFQETYRLIYQDDPPTQDQTSPPWPHQELVDDPELAAWPVYLGTITWDVGQMSITAVDSADSRDKQSRRYVGLVGAEIFSPTPTQTLDVRAKKTTFDQDIVVNQDIVVKGTTGDGAGRLRLDVDSQDASVITNKKAPTSTEPSPPSGDIYLRTNNEAGGNKVIIDKDTLQAKTAQVSEDLTVDNNITAQGRVTAKQLDVTESAVIQGGLTVDAGTDLNIHGGQLALKEVGGGEDTDPMRIFRHKRGADQNDMRLQIGDNIGGDDRLVVGPVYYADGQFKERFIVKNNGDTTIAGNLTVSGDISPGGRVDGRDVAADGAKLDGISAHAKNVAALSGVLEDGETIPLPLGFTEAQCQWIVSPNLYNPPKFDINEIGANAQFRVECRAESNRTVRVGWWQRGHSSSPTWKRYSGWANYIIIGIK